MQIINKLGTLEEFNPEKIIKAVSKAAERAMVVISESDFKTIIDTVKNILEGKDKVTVPQMHNAVERSLDINGYDTVWKEYRNYRNYKTELFGITDKAWKKKKSLQFIADKENANTDSALVTTKRCLVYGELNKEFYRKFFMNPDEREACNKGYIYIHDQNARLDCFNCVTRDTRFITSQGVKSFYDFMDGDECVVLTHKGNWKKAVVRSHGWQPIQKITLKRGASKEKIVRATKDHRWLLKDGSETTSLGIGDQLIRTPNIAEFEWSELSLADRTWKVMNIEPEKLNPKAEVWCLEVEDDHSFILEGGIPTGNCSLFNFGQVLEGGFEMGNLPYTEPKSLETAFGVMNSLILSVASQQYGGFTLPEVDKVMAKYALKTYDHYLDEYIKDYKDITESNNNIPSNIMKKFEDKATAKVQRDFEQGWQGIEMTLNSVASARGDYPFITITMGLDESKFGKMATISYFNVHAKGQGKPGKEKPVLFPKSVFLYDKAIHGQGKSSRDVYIAARNCSAKTMYPDWLSLSGKGYVSEMYQKYKRVVSPMGSVDGMEMVRWKDETGRVRTFTMEVLWNTYTKLYPCKRQEHSTEERDVYLEPKGLQVYDTSSNGWVDILFITRNWCSNWCKVILENDMEIIITQDHPLQTPKGRVLANELKEGDFVFITSNGEKAMAKIETIEMIYNHDQYGYDFTTSSDKFDVSGFCSHNCRAFLSPWFERGGMYPADDDDKPVFEGRFNIGVVSLHLPMIYSKAKRDNKDFFEVLDYYLEMIRNIHKKTYEYLGKMKASINPVGFCEGGFYGGHLKPTDTLESILKPMTASFGITALNELQRLHNGKSLVQDNTFALNTMKYINKRVEQFKKEDGWLYAIYSTPSENLCFSGDTAVQVYGGDKLIKDIKVGDLVYSYNEEKNKIELKPVIRSFMTSSSAKVLKINFTNGQHIICTPNHKFAVRKMRMGESNRFAGEYFEWVEAKDFKPGTRIKSNYRQITKNGRYQFTTNQYEHEVVAEYFYGEKPEGYVVHHKDENKMNNMADNLVYMSDADHRRLHMKDTIEKHKFKPGDMVGEKNLFYGKHHTEETKQLLREKKSGKNNPNSRPLVKTDLEGHILQEYESAGQLYKNEPEFRNVSYAVRGKASLTTHPEYKGHYYNGYLWYRIEDIENYNKENHKVESIEYLDEEIPVYDITVADNHNFYVGGADGILVHNCGVQVQQYRAEFGIVENVSDREFVSNGFHCHVTEDITPIQKQDLESQFWDYSDGGKIQYVRYPLKYNLEAIDTLIERAMEYGFYEGVNLSLAYCEECGYEELNMDVCPKCGSHNLTKIDRMNGYLAYSRVKGDTRLNKAKMEELKVRVSV